MRRDAIAAGARTLRALAAPVTHCTPRGRARASARAAAVNTEVLSLVAVPERSAPREALSARSLRSGSWTLVGNLASQALRFGSSLVLTRLLFPEAFGPMAIAQRSSPPRACCPTSA